MTLGWLGLITPRNRAERAGRRHVRLVRKGMSAGWLTAAGIRIEERSSVHAAPTLSTSTVAQVHVIYRDDDGWWLHLGGDAWLPVTPQDTEHGLLWRDVAKPNTKPALIPWQDIR